MTKKLCPECGGTGKVKEVRGDPMRHPVTVLVDCPKCQMRDCLDAECDGRMRKVLVIVCDNRALNHWVWQCDKCGHEERVAKPKGE